MLQDSLQFRRDLVVSQSDQSGAITYVIKDPRSQRYFRFCDVEGFVVRQLDGVTSVEEIRRRAETLFDAALPESSLRNFLSKLQSLGLLENQGPSMVPVQGRGRARGTLFYLRWKAFDPDRLFARLSKNFWWLFTPAFVAVSAALIVVALGITLGNYGTIGRRLPALYRPDVFVSAWLVLLAVIICHEFAHGLTCKHFGGQVNELGFMLIFFQPAMYCNVSDAWLFPELRKRLWVTFAGAYFEMFLWAIATVVWWASDPNTLLNVMALIVLLTSGIKTLFNLNPLIKLDGYYLLSDLLNIPNLNRNAMSYVRRVFRLFPAREVASRAPAFDLRQRRILLFYGVSSWVFSISLLAWLLWSLGKFLTARYQAAGFLATVGLLVAFFHRPLLGKFTAMMGPSSNGLQRTTRRRLHAFAFLVVAFGAVLFFVHTELTVSAPFTAHPVHYAEVRAEVEGMIERVLVNEDERVTEGQEIARLCDRSWRSELDKINAEIAATKARLKMLKSGPREEEVELARHEVETGRVRWEKAREQLETALRVQGERLARSRSSVEKAEAQLGAAREEMERIRKLVSDGAGSPKELNDSVSIVVVREKELAETEGDIRVESADDLIHYRQSAMVAQSEFQEAQSRLALLQAGSRIEVVEAAAADLDRLEAQRAYYQSQIQHLNILSPIAGVITTPRLMEMIGRRVDRGDLIASVHDMSQMRAEIAVPEKEFADIAVGQEVLLKVRAFPNRDFRGTIKTISPIASPREELIAGRAILITAELENPGFLLKPEMTGQCKIYCGQRRWIDILTRRIFGYIRIEFWSWW